MPHSKFITFEGGEGAGKSTQIRLLSDRLTAAGYSLLVTREPGGSPGAEEIRRLLVTGDPGRWNPWTEALLHFAARRDHLEQRIWPELERGTWVLCDRFADSTMAYQGYGSQLGRKPIEHLSRLVLNGFRPDLTLILDVPVEQGLARAAARRDHENRYETMDRAFHQRLRQGFQEIAEREPKRCVTIDASGKTEEVHALICETVSKRLGVVWP